MDLDSATKKEPVALPGIGEANARKITDNRPCQRTDELSRKNIMPKAVWDKIKGLVIASARRWSVRPA